MTPLDMLRSARQQSQRWRDLLWESLLEELEERDPGAAAAARAAISRPARPLFGASTQDAALAWPYLDAEARLDWIWVCQFVNGIWIEAIRSLMSSSSSGDAA